ncbi:hypothetical protein H2200_004277 [Cladophialophora chaetospira]|uniref:Uncharacterized protein n=1 Tax=Cladophialophora chaetospira TaxID=386627 RepID=A0AA38XCZ3_9EURO|nr:hypothetical protein H2200_004277 [Cladophialophora chaetospira]
MASNRNALAFLDTPSRGVPDRRHSTDHSRTTPLNMSRNGSTSSVASRQSEPGINGLDRGRAGSAPEKTTTKPSSGFGKLFGKKKEKKDMDKIVITSRHAAAVKTRLALDPKFQTERRDSAPVYITSATQNNLLISASEKEMRHPHSGPPAVFGPKEKMNMPILTRVVSGDEADEPDEWEKMRREWRQRKVPLPEHDIIEGVAVDGHSSGQSTADEEEKDIEVPQSEVVERQGVRILSVAGMTGDEYSPRPSRTHTPIGGRWKKDEKGVWKR